MNQKLEGVNDLAFNPIDKFFPVKDHEITKAIYVLGSKSAFRQGHSGLILVNKEGKGTFYSAVFNIEKNPSILVGKNVPYKLFKKELGVEDIDNYFKTGIIPETSKEFIDMYYLSHFNKYITIPVPTKEQGKAILERAESLVKSPGEFNIIEYNCNHIIQDILSAGKLNFGPTKREDKDFGKNIKKMVQSVIEKDPIKVAYNGFVTFNSFYDAAITPNSAYVKGIRWAKKNNYEYGSIKIEHGLIKPIIEEIPERVIQSIKKFVDNARKLDFSRVVDCILKVDVKGSPETYEKEKVMTL